MRKSIANRPVTGADITEQLQPLKRQRRRLSQGAEICLKITLVGMVLVTCLAVASGLVFMLQAGTLGVIFHLTVGVGVFCILMMLMTGCLMKLKAKQGQKIISHESQLIEETNTGAENEP